MNDFIEFLYSYFPHRWLNKKAEGTKKLFSGLGKSIDYLEEYIDLLKKNNSVRTSDELITDLENEYGLVINPSLDIEFRRKRIIAKMRMQDSPITKESLIQILQILGLINCNIYTDYRKFLMTTTFELENKDYKETSIITNEVYKILNENVRAHIIFNFNAIIKDFFENINDINITNLIILSYFKNFELEVIYLDNGEKKLDGTWNLQTYTKSINLTHLIISGHINDLQKINVSTNLQFLMYFKNNIEKLLLSSEYGFSINNKTIQTLEMKKLIINSSIKEIVETISSSLTIDTMWYLDNTYNLNNERKLNAGKIKITLLYEE